MPPRSSHRPRRHRVAASPFVLAVALLGCPGAQGQPDWEAANPLQPLPQEPLGLTSRLADLPVPPTSERVRLGRWLFFDPRLSADGTVSCATCHRPANAFSETTPVSTGVGGRQGTRKSPALVNLAWAPRSLFFWDGRAGSLEAQALGPIANPVEMGSSVEAMLMTLEGVATYRSYFAEAFGTPAITAERVAHALADYERTRLSGASAWDRWRAGDEAAVTAEVKAGDALFFGRAGCGGCHGGQDLTDGGFHNLGIGWDPVALDFADQGRFGVTGQDADRGAFKTPTLRDVARHAPYMHDGSLATLEAVVRHYARGGTPNPWLSDRLSALELTDAEVGALVALLGALDGTGPLEEAPAAFPR